jgi:hypothetical protein
MDVLLDDGYRVDVRASADSPTPSSTRPSRAPRELTRATAKPGWVNDRRNVDELLGFLEADASGPSSRSCS